MSRLTGRQVAIAACLEALPAGALGPWVRDSQEPAWWTAPLQAVSAEGPGAPTGHLRATLQSNVADRPRPSLALGWMLGFDLPSHTRVSWHETLQIVHVDLHARPILPTGGATEDVDEAAHGRRGAEVPWPRWIQAATLASLGGVERRAAVIGAALDAPAEEGVRLDLAGIQHDRELVTHLLRHAGRAARLAVLAARGAAVGRS